ncbi:hypothetical protein ACLKA7_015517 [Drosophila subpalustris]
MSNITLMRLAKLQPLFHMVGSSYAALTNADVTLQPNNINSTNDNNNYSNNSGSVSNVNNNHSSDNFLLLLEENYSNRSTSTIVLMVAAWILLILGFVFCCCAECFGISVWRGKKRTVISLSGAEGGSASTTTANGDELSDLHAGEFLCTRAFSGNAAEAEAKAVAYFSALLRNGAAATTTKTMKLYLICFALHTHSYSASFALQ